MGNQIKNFDLSIIIPAYNEALRIEETVKDIQSYLSKESIAAEIIVVNDGSTDQTAEIIRSLGQQYNDLHFLESKKNEGKGSAVKKGMLSSSGKICLFIDADNSTRINQIKKLNPYLEKGFDVVIGSRAMPETEILIQQPLPRVLFGKLGNKLIQWLTIPGIKDTQCGFKAFSYEAAQNIFPKLTINGWGFDIELLALARHLGLKIHEVGITWVNSADSHVKFRDYFRVIRDLLIIKWNILRKKY